MGKGKKEKKKLIIISKLKILHAIHIYWRMPLVVAAFAGKIIDKHQEEKKSKDRALSGTNHHLKPW